MVYCLVDLHNDDRCCTSGLIYKIKIDGLFSGLIYKMMIDGLLTGLIYKTMIDGLLTGLSYKMMMDGLLPGLSYKMMIDVPPCARSSVAKSLPLDLLRDYGSNIS